MTQATLTNATTILLLGLLILATCIDLGRSRIPNALTASGIVLGFGLQFALGGAGGLAAATGGLLIGGLAFLPFYVWRAMGAGDIKLMALVGTFLGPVATLLAAGMTLVVGGLMAVAVLLYRRGGTEALNRYRDMFVSSTLLRRFQYLPPSTGAAAATRFPYAAAIAAGAVSALYYTSRLDGVVALVFA